MNKGHTGVVIFKDGAHIKVVKDSPNAICKEISKHKTFPTGKLVYNSGGKIVSHAYTKGEFKSDVTYILKHRVGFSKESLKHLCKLAKIVIPKELKEVKTIRKKTTVKKRR